MAQLTAETLRKLFSGRSILIVAAWMAVLIWGIQMIGRQGTMWDSSGMELGEARRLVAEVAPGTRVTLVTPSPLESVLIPMARQSPNLRVTVVKGNDLPDELRHGPVPLKAGDVQVETGGSWLVLNQPDLPKLLSTMALVSSPKAVSPRRPAPLDILFSGVSAGDLGPLDARTRGLLWIVTGLFLPLAVAGSGLVLGLKRRGR